MNKPTKHIVGEHGSFWSIQKDSAVLFKDTVNCTIQKALEIGNGKVPNRIMGFPVYQCTSLRQDIIFVAPDKKSAEAYIASIAPKTFAKQKESTNESATTDGK